MKSLNWKLPYLQRCDSPNIAKVYDCFEENSSIYMVMEFIDGVPLSNFVANQNRLQESKVIEYIKQIANALVVVHQNKLLHRDIKPENIMIDSSDRAVFNRLWHCTRVHRWQNRRPNTTTHPWICTF